MSKVRLLFAPENTGFADKLALALAQSGYDTSGEDDPASAALVIWSQASAASKPILSAARSALARRVLVPVALGKTPPPPSFEHLWPMDLAGWNGRPDDPRWKFVLDELELATRRGVVFRPAAANDRGDPAKKREPQPATPDAAPIAAAAETPDAAAPALFAEERIETIRPRPKFPRVAIGAGFVVAALAGAGAAALLIGVSDGRRSAGKKAPVVAFVVQPRAEPAPAEIIKADPAVAPALTPPPVIAPALPPSSTPEAGAATPATALRDGSAPPPDAPVTDERIADELAAIVDRPSPGAPLEALVATKASAGPVRAASGADMAVVAAAPDPGEIDPIAGLAWSATGSSDAETASFGRYLRDCVDCPDLAELDAGSFLMGAAAGDPAAKGFEGPQKPVRLTRKIAMAVRETTFEDWGRCVADGACKPVADAGWGRGKRPVINVGQADAGAYAAWLSAKTGQRYRLPTEAEWEYAARAGSSAPFSFGPVVDASRANYNASAVDPSGAPGRRRGVTEPAGSFAPNAFGLFDMHGNVWEWTADCWRASHDGRAADAAAVGGACAARVVKGGAWNAPASSLRSAHRDGVIAETRRNDVGFRVVRDVD